MSHGAWFSEHSGSLGSFFSHIRSNNVLVTLNCRTGCKYILADTLMLLVKQSGMVKRGKGCVVSNKTTWTLSKGFYVVSVAIHYLVCGWQLWYFKSSEFSLDEAGGQRPKLDSSGWAKVQPHLILRSVHKTCHLTELWSLSLQCSQGEMKYCCRDGKQAQDILKISPTTKRASGLGLQSCGV